MEFQVKYLALFLLVSSIGWCPQLLLGTVRQVKKTNMKDCWSFTCCFSWTLGSWSNVASLSPLYRYYFGRCSSELAQLIPLLFSRGKSTRYSDRLHNISVTIPRCYKDVYVKSLFPRTARFWKCLPIECFLLTYDLSGFKFRINRHLLTVESL